MNTVLRRSLIVIALFTLVILGAACGGSDTAEEAGGGTDDVAVSGNSDVGVVNEAETGAPPINVQDAESVIDAFKQAAALEGIYFGEVPEGFPLDIIPVHPDGVIDKSSVDPEGFTLLQVVTGEQDAVFGWFKEHFEGMGWDAGEPFEFGGRAMVGFIGSDAEVQMTLSIPEEGKVFVSQVLSPK